MRLQRRATQRLVARLAAAAAAEHAQAVAEDGDADQRILRVEIEQGQAAASIGLQLELVEPEHEQSALERETGDARRAGRHQSRRQRLLVVLETEERFAAALARDQIAGPREQAEATRACQQQQLRCRTGEVVRGLRAGLHVDERCDRLAVAAAARQCRHGGGIEAAVAAEDEQRVDAAAGECPVEPVAGLERELARVDLVALQGAHPAFQADRHGDRLVDDAHFRHRPLAFLDQRAPLVAVRLRIGLDLANDRALQQRRARQHVAQASLLGLQLLQLLLDADRLEPCQLAEADLENVVGLPLAQGEALHQRRLRLVGGADQRDHLVDIEQDELPPVEHVNPVGDARQPVLRTPLDRLQAIADPLGEHLPQALLRRPAVGADHRHVDRRGALEARVREQRRQQIVLRRAARLRLEHQPHRRLLARLVSNGIEHGEHRGLELQLLGPERFLAGADLRVGELLDLLEHLLRAGARRQLGDDDLPLAARQLLDLPAGADLQRAPTGRVGGPDLVGRTDDLGAAGEVGAGQQRREGVVAQRLVAQQRDRRRGDLAQVVARDLGGETDCDAAGAVEQHERQARRQQPRLFGRAVVVGNEIDRAFVDLVEQQPCDRREPRFGVAHRGGAIAVARAEVALAVDQRIALREALRHAHQRVVGGLVAVRMEAAEHVADDACALDRLRSGRGREGEAHPRHRVEDATLDGLLAVADVGQGAALDDGERVLEIRALRVLAEGDAVVPGWGVEEVGGHGGGRWEALLALEAARRMASIDASNASGSMSRPTSGMRMGLSLRRRPSTGPNIQRT